jgi:acetolactate synthase-1/2/3 large subunit
MDIATFLTAVNSIIIPELHVDQGWLAAISSIKRDYSIWQENSALDLDVNVYEFMEKMSDALEASDVIVTDAGGNLSWTMQAVRVTKLQKIFSAWNHSPMGYSLPAAIGAAISSPLSKIICIIGDGGLMMTLSEIATIRRNDLNIKIIVINNLGHGIQKQTIETWLDSNYVGVDEASGLYFPNFEAVAQSFGVPHFRVSSNSEILELFQNKIWLNSAPVLIEIMVDKNQRITPMLKFGTGLSDLNPRVDAPNLID